MNRSLVHSASDVRITSAIDLRLHRRGARPGASRVTGRPGSSHRIWIQRERTRNRCLAGSTRSFRHHNLELRSAGQGVDMAPRNLLKPASSIRLPGSSGDGLDRT